MDKANFLVLDDLNTMVVQYPFDRDMEAGAELKKLDREARKVRMRRLTKSGERIPGGTGRARAHPPTSMMSWLRST